MANVSSGIVLDANLLNLKEIDSSKIRPEVKDLGYISKMVNIF